MKNSSIFILICLSILLIGCATPPTVKQAIKKQSQAYEELQATIFEFKQLYVELNQQLFRLNQESQSRIEALSMVRGLSGEDPKLEGVETWAGLKSNDIKHLATKLDEIPASRGEILKVYTDSINNLKEALVHGTTESKKKVQEIQKTLKAVEKSNDNAIREIRALMVIHDTVGEYLEIDLTPEAKALKEAITAIKALKE